MVNINQFLAVILILIQVVANFDIIREDMYSPDSPWGVTIDRLRKPGNLPGWTVKGPKKGTEERVRGDVYTERFLEEKREEEELLAMMEREEGKEW